MEINKTYFIKRLKIDGELQPQDTCVLLQLNNDGTCVVESQGQVYLFLQDMLSESPDEIFGELKSAN